jgi:hypothetical protein
MEDLRTHPFVEGSSPALTHSYHCTSSLTMPFLPRLRLDIALGLLIAGTIWYIGTRPRTRPRPGDHVQLTDEDDTPIVEGALEALKPLLYEPALLERIMVLSDPRTMIRVAQVRNCSPDWFLMVGLEISSRTHHFLTLYSIASS